MNKEEKKQTAHEVICEVLEEAGKSNLVKEAIMIVTVEGTVGQFRSLLDGGALEKGKFSDFKIKE